MLKLGTVFSGIGAIEHALKRLGVEFECSFACDNGGVDIFSKKIERNIDSIQSEVNSLERRLAEVRNRKFKDDDYAISLNEHLEHIKTSLKELKFESIDLGDILAKNDKLTGSMQGFLKFIKQKGTSVKISKPLEGYSEIEFSNIPFYNYFLLANEIKDFYKSHKENNDLQDYIEMSYEEYESLLKVISDSAQVKQVKAYINELIDIINMLHQRITTMESLVDLSMLSSYKEKKDYVDNMYSGKEKSNFVRQSYLANYEIHEDHFHWNASFLDGTQYKDKIDLFVGGSPCQSFSLVGKRRGLQDTRGTLFYEFARLIGEIQPKVFIYENVKGLLGHDGGNTWATMQQVFKDLNYEWQFDILNAKNYGVPQNRERLFVVGIRKDLVLKGEFHFPEEKKLDKTMKDFLLDNVSAKYYLNKKGVEFVTMEKNLQKRFTQIDGDIQLCQKANQQFNWHGDFVFVEENKEKENLIDDLEKYFLSEKVRKYVMASGTKNFYSKPKIDLDIARPLLTTMHKMHRAGVDNYVTTEGRIRKLAPRECLRLMGFCDSFEIVVSDTQMYQQAGNSIVVDVLMAIFKKIAECLPEIITGGDYEYKDVDDLEEPQIEEKETTNKFEQLSLL
jgi:DNA (cytosine-5)-methyltransferase 1